MILRQNTINSDVVLNLRPGNEQSDHMPRLFVIGKHQQMSESKAKNIYSKENPQERLARVYIVKRNTLDQSNVDIKVETTIGSCNITYNGKEVQIQRDSLFRGNYGICGAHSGQRYNELRTPQNRCKTKRNSLHHGHLLKTNNPAMRWNASNERHATPNIQKKTHCTAIQFQAQDVHKLH